MGAQVEVELAGVGDDRIDASSRGNVLRLADGVGGTLNEEASVVAFLDDDEGDRRLVLGSDIRARLADIHHLLLQNMHKFALRDAVTVDDDVLRFLRCRLVEVAEALFHQIDEVDDAFHTLVLHFRLRGVFCRPHVDIADDRRDRRRVLVADARMRHVDAQEQRRSVVQDALAPSTANTLSSLLLYFHHPLHYIVPEACFRRARAHKTDQLAIAIAAKL